MSAVSSSSSFPLGAIGPTGAQGAQPLPDPFRSRSLSVDQVDYHKDLRITYTDKETKNILTRFAIKKNLLNGGDQISRDQLTKEEIGCFTQALDHLKNRFNVVLVDFFARKTFKIKGVEQTTTIGGNRAKAEIHTICMHKINPNDIQLIDPSDSNHSVFLEDVLNKMFPQKKFTPLIHKGPINSNKNYFYYFPRKFKPGKKQNEFRDCIDISVKIGFIFMNQSYHGIESLSNRSILNPLLVDIESIDTEAANKNPKIKAEPLRDIQSSSSKKREKVRQLLETYQLLSDKYNFMKIKKVETTEELEVLVNSMEEAINIGSKIHPNAPEKIKDVIELNTEESLIRTRMSLNTDHGLKLSLKQ